LQLSRLLPVLAFFLLISGNAAFAAGSKSAEVAGAVLFRDKGCAYCHGIAAQGTTRGPSLATVRKRLKAAQIVDQIENGGQKMPSFQDSLTKDEIMQLVQFLRAKHRPTAPPVPAPAPITAPVVNPAQ
jgi:mono/diheme cytochrome c family protein